jgi:hypothetical protein
MAPLGLIIAGPVADALGIRAWYIVGGFVTLFMGVAGFLTPAVLYVEDGGNNLGDEAAMLSPAGGGVVEAAVSDVETIERYETNDFRDSGPATIA